MKLPFQKLSHSPAGEQGFTLAEVMIALTIFLLMIIGIISANLFGLSMFQMNQTKLNATRWSRETIEYMTDQIHTCNSLSILNVDTNGNFIGLIPGELQQGNALQIYPTTNTSNYVIYFVSPADQTFRRATDQISNAVILADSITNTLPFSAQDLAGNILTNSQNNQVIHLTLEFYQPQLFLQDAAYYKVDTGIKQRIEQ
jgi:type II secretory pathway pseudopilin PulG